MFNVSGLSFQGASDKFAIKVGKNVIEYNIPTKFGLWTARVNEFTKTAEMKVEGEDWWPTCLENIKDMAEAYAEQILKNK